MYNLIYFTEALAVGHWLTVRSHSHFHVHYASTVGILVQEVFGHRVSLTIHGSGEFINPAEFALAEKIHASTFVRAISHFGKSQLMLHSPPAEWQKYEVVPLGLETAQYRRATVRQKPHPFNLICIGRLVHGKGYEVLIEALSLLQQQSVDVRLTIVGDGPVRGYLEAMAARLVVPGSVVFSGWMRHSSIRDMLCDADAFVLASFAEGVPVVLMEAMAAALPCIATRIAGVPELIRDGIDGVLITPAHSGELVKAITRLQQSPDLRQYLGLNARTRVCDLYELSTQVQRLATVFSTRCG